MKKVLAIILSVAMLLTALGTVAFSAIAENTTYNVVDVKDYIRTVGRTAYTSDGLYLTWTASGFEFSANCSGDVALTIKSNCNDTGSEGDHNRDLYFTVYIDGVRKDERLRVMNGTYTVNLAEDLSSGDHTFKVIKQNEYTATTCTIQSIAFDGNFLAKPAAQKRVIEFIGDSITTGYASLAPGSDDNAQRYSDGTRTYAYVTAENFDAEARVTAISGGTCPRLYNAYKYNVSNGTSETPYDFSLTKPDVVVISLGGNDGLQTPEYWLNHFKNFTDMIREGYNDYSIPIIYAHNITQSHRPQLRSYVSAAFKTLKAQDPEKYSNFYMVSGGYASGHPRQDKHLFAAKKLTQCIVNNGLLPIDELKADATVTLTATNTKVETVNSFDSVINITGATSEVVEALDPNDNGGALKFTTDGTQAETAGSEFSVKANMAKYRYKGFGVYVNFKNLSPETPATPYLQVKASDQKFIQPLEYSNDGETARFEVLWDDMADVGYTYIRGLCSTSYPIRFATYISSGKYEMTLDSLELLVNDYEVTDNPNSTYKVLSSVPFYGITDNYNKAEATAATDPSDNSLTFEAEDLTFTSNSGTGTLTANNDYNCGKNEFVVLNSSSPAVGNYIEFTLPNVEAGTYKLSVPTRATPSRSSFDVSVNGTATASNVSFAYTDGTANFVADYVSIDCGHIIIDQTGSVKLRFTISAAGTSGVYMDKIKLTPVADGEVPSTEPSTEPSEPEVPSTIPSSNPSDDTQAQTYTFEAEEISGVSTNTGTGTYTANNDYNCGYNTFFVMDGTSKPVVGHYVEFTLPAINAGTYKITVPTRASSNRSSFNISVNDVVTASNVSFASPSADYVTFDCGTATISETGDVKIRFTISTATAAGVYIDKIILTPVSSGNEDEEPSSEPSSSSSVTTPSEEIPEESSSSTIPVGNAKAKIGNVEYASLFGADGAIANAVDGDVIVMVADESIDFALTSSSTPFVTINKAITIDLAGHTVTGNRTSSTKGRFIQVSAATTIRSTVYGLGVTNTETQGTITANSIVLYTMNTLNVSNSKIISTYSDDTYGSAIQIYTSNTITLSENAFVKAPRRAFRCSVSNSDVDVKNSTIEATNNPIYGSGLSGTILNSNINFEQSGINFTAGELEIKDSQIAHIGTNYDWTAVLLNGGTLKLTNISINCKTRAKYGISITGTSKLVTDNVTISATKAASGTYPLNIASTATAQLGNMQLTGSTSSNSAANVNLYPYLAEGKAIYTSEEPSEDTLVPQDYAPADYRILYIRDTLSAVNVTIDGKAIEVVGGKVTLPVSSVSGFVAYTDGENLYDANEVLEVTKDLALTTVSAGETQMITGASMRLKTPSGIRFYTEVDIDKISALRNDGFTVSLGTLIAPEDLIGTNDLTHELEVEKFVDVKFNSNNYYVEDDFEGVVGSIANVKDTNANRNFIGRGYIIVTKGDYTKVIYADYADNDINNNKRTISWIATQVKASSLYETVSDVIKGYIDHYVALYKED